MDILSVLKQEHRAVSALIDQVQQCEPDDPQLDELAKKIEQELSVHAELEEKIFYPELRDRAEESDERVDVFEAYTEHEVVKHLIALLKSGRKRDELFKAELQVLGENVKHHVKEEESTIFSLARELLEREELDELGERFEQGKARMMSRASANGRRTGSRKKSSAKRSGRTKKTSRSR
ncbi:MAG: hemerythrin domain-containing protein [Candidatus Eremiobacteraeota bacterium]|nr:hemerythrin domain-containing protein [Candidatus Eremiobacteraeota bacterium]MBV9263919.1 hemerythrin domain-containing protein [Candidatus Eremiobacteraeota bacterium]